MDTSFAKRSRAQNKTGASVAMVSASEDDQDASRKAVMKVVQLWLARLQTVSGITTFFASIDTTLLSFTIGLTRLNVLNTSEWPRTTQLLHASLAGALIFHVCAAITSFVASFVLIRYRLMDARRDMPRTNPIVIPPTPIEKPSVSRVESAPPGAHLHARSNSTASHRPSSPLLQAVHLPDLFQLFQSWSDIVSQYENRVFIHQVQPLYCFRRRHRSLGDDPAHQEPNTPIEPPIRLLSNAHTLSVTMAVIGFVLALLGILTFTWTTLPLSVGVFSSACLGLCLLAIFATFSFC